MHIFIYNNNKNINYVTKPTINKCESRQRYL